MESLRNVIPRTITRTATTSPATYSVLPCPNGCSASGGAPEIRKPMAVISPVPASERLLTASAAIAILPAYTASVILTTASTALHTIPVIPLMIPQRTLFSGVSTSFAPGTNIFKSKFVNIKKSLSKDRD